MEVNMGCYVYIAVSLDGYIARSDGNIDWLTAFSNIVNSDCGYAEFMSHMDGIVMGRKTFETVARFDPWPYAKPVFVLSRSLKHLDKRFEGCVMVVHETPAKLMGRLAMRGINELYIDGGETVRSFLREDLIDGMIITRVPVLLGGGIPLFIDNPKELLFEHVATQVFDDILVTSTYRRRR